MSEDFQILEINSIKTIIEYVNNLATHHIKPTNDLSKKIESYAKIIDDRHKEEFMENVKENKIYKASKSIFQNKYEIINKNVSEIILNLTQCIDVVQGLKDEAKSKKEIDPYKEFYFTALIGALEELCYHIDPTTKELLLKSKDQTHLRKTLMAIYSNASKLISLEKKLVDVPDLEFEKFLMTRNSEEQKIIIEDFLIPKFKPNWVLLMKKEKIKKIFDFIMDNADDVGIPPLTLVKVFGRWSLSERKKFLEHLRVSLSGEEYKIITAKQEEG